MGPQFSKLFNSSSIMCTTMSSSGGGLLMVAGVSLVVVCLLKGSCLFCGEGSRALRSPTLPPLPILSRVVENLPKVASSSISFHSAQSCNPYRGTLPHRHPLRYPQDCPPSLQNFNRSSSPMAQGTRFANASADLSSACERSLEVPLTGIHSASLELEL